QQAFNAAMGEREPPPPPSPEQLQILEAIPREPAAQVVLRAVEEHPLVILNEAHHQPEHRAFAARLMPELAAAGVRYFAREPQSQKRLDEAVKSDGVTSETDPYSFEPQRAELLRAVLRSGLKPVAIDFRSPEEEEEVRQYPERAMLVREASMAR